MANEYLQKHTLNLRKGDWDFIADLGRPSGLDTSTIIRTIVSKFVDAQQAQEAVVDTSEFKVEL